MTRYSLSEIRNGTGWSKGTEFAEMRDVTPLLRALEEIERIPYSLNDQERCEIARIARKAREGFAS